MSEVEQQPPQGRDQQLFLLQQQVAQLLQNQSNGHLVAGPNAVGPGGASKTPQWFLRKKITSTAWTTYKIKWSSKLDDDDWYDDDDDYHDEDEDDHDHYHDDNDHARETNHQKPKP